MVSLDELVLDMRDIMELSYIFHTENKVLEKEELLNFPSEDQKNEGQFVSVVYDLLKNKLEKFYRECYLTNTNVLNESLFYAESLVGAYQDDKVLEFLAKEIVNFINDVLKDLYINDTQDIIKK